MNTERPSPRYSEIDSWEPCDALEGMIEGQFAAVAAVRAARVAIEEAARAMEARLRYRGRLVYVGAGTSGRLAAHDGAELMPTFSRPTRNCCDEARTSSCALRVTIATRRAMPSVARAAASNWRYCYRTDAI